MNNHINLCFIIYSKKFETICLLLWQKNFGGTGWWGLILSKYHLQNFWQGGRQRWSVQGIRGNDQTNTNRFGISNAIDNLSCNFLIKREKRLKNWATELCPLIINIIDKSLWKFCVILAKLFRTRIVSMILGMLSFYTYLSFIHQLFYNLSLLHVFTCNFSILCLTLLIRWNWSEKDYFITFWTARLVGFTSNQTCR